MNARNARNAMRMKWVLVGLALAAFTTAVAASSCTINHRSDGYVCETSATCEPGRVCVNGLCVAASGPDARPDAPKPDAPPPDAGVCPAGCTQCADGKVCIIDCQAGASCNGPIVCPPGFNCVIRCNLQGACRAGINCTGAASCDVQCTGRNSCRNVTCGPGPCRVGCTGQNTCESVSCGMSCACDVTCGFANGSCFNVQCTSLLCDTGLGCTSSRPGCETCP